MKLTDDELHDKGFRVFPGHQWGIGLGSRFWLEMEQDGKWWMSCDGHHLPVNIETVEQLDTLLAATRQGAQGQN